LEAGVFKLPKLTPGTRSVELRASELAMLLEGIDLSKLKRTPRYQRPPETAAKIETERASSGNAGSSADA
jgi:transposase